MLKVEIKRLKKLISMLRRMRLLEKDKLLKRTKFYCLRLISCSVINTEIY